MAARRAASASDYSSRANRGSSRAGAHAGTNYLLDGPGVRSAGVAEGEGLLVLKIVFCGIPPIAFDAFDGDGSAS
jgi:hypothetical protein